MRRDILSNFDWIDVAFRIKLRKTEECFVVAVFLFISLTGFNANDDALINTQTHTHSLTVSILEVSHKLMDQSIDYVRCVAQNYPIDAMPELNTAIFRTEMVNWGTRTRPLSTMNGTKNLPLSQFGNAITSVKRRLRKKCKYVCGLIWIMWAHRAVSIGYTHHTQ